MKIPCSDSFKRSTIYHIKLLYFIRGILKPYEYLQILEESSLLYKPLMPNRKRIITTLNNKKQQYTSTKINDDLFIFFSGTICCRQNIFEYQILTFDEKRKNSYFLLARTLLLSDRFQLSRSRDLHSPAQTLNLDVQHSMRDS